MGVRTERIGFSTVANSGNSPYSRGVPQYGPYCRRSIHSSSLSLFSLQKNL